MASVYLTNMTDMAATSSGIVAGMYVFSVDIAPDGTVFVGGGRIGTGGQENTLVVMAYKDGQFLWEKQFRNNDYYGYVAAVKYFVDSDGDGHLYAAGSIGAVSNIEDLGGVASPGGKPEIPDTIPAGYENYYVENSRTYPIYLKLDASNGDLEYANIMPSRVVSTDMWNSIQVDQQENVYVAGGGWTPGPDSSDPYSGALFDWRTLGIDSEGNQKWGFEGEGPVEFGQDGFVYTPFWQTFIAGIPQDTLANQDGWKFWDVGFTPSDTNQGALYGPEYYLDTFKTIDTKFEYIQYERSQGTSGMVWDESGNLYALVSRSYGNIQDLNSGALADGVAVYKFDPSGSIVWCKQLNTTSDSSEPVYESNGFIVNEIPAGHSSGSSIAFDANGNLVIAGSTYSDIAGAQSYGSSDGFIIKMNPDDGNLLSTWVVGTEGYEDIRQIKYDSSGNLLIAGQFGAKVYSIEGTDYEDIYLITPEGFKLIGNDLDNLISAGSGADELLGAVGNDVLIGGSGNDIINGGVGLDTASYGFALNAVNIDLSKGKANGINSAGLTETGTDTLLGIENATGGAGNDRLVGSDSANILYGGDGNDTVSAGKGNDVIIGGDGAGDDTYDGGDGIDTVKYTSAVAGITVNLSLKSRNAISTSTDSGIGVDKLTKVENIIAGNYNDIIIGDGSNNTLEGMDGADSINGNNGNDVVNGGLGNDTLTGGAGNDTFVINSGVDTITDLGNGQDILQVTSGVLNATVSKAWVARSGTYNNAEVNLTSNGQSVNLNAVTSGTHGFDITNTGKAATFIGSAFDDSITGGSGDDTLNGRAGTNVLNGGSGNDAYIIDISGATNSDVIFNEVYDSQGVDKLSFTVTSAEFDAINDSWFSIRRLNDGKDLAIGVFDDNNEEPINGVIIKDQFNYVGGSFNNTINTITLKAPETENKSITFNIAVTGSSSSQLIGTKGVDYMAGFGGSQTLNGGAGNDILTASRFDTEGNIGDTIYGEAGNDDISGKEGNDTLNGGVGNDELTGGSGADTFIFDMALKSNLDKITDFEHLLDEIQLSLSIFTNIKGADSVFDGADLLSGSWTGKQKVNASSSNEHLIFNTANNGVYYDADGSGKGAAVQFATLVGVNTISVDDFSII